jgi:ferredoxin--NADP+ reductase
MTSSAEKYTPQQLIAVRPWAPNLFSFCITRDPVFHFVPGQFARLGVAPPGVDATAPGAIVWRAYSVVSPADAPHLEFFSIVIPGGAFTPALARQRPGSVVYMERTSYGFLTLERFEPARDLWMLCTGTGLAPFLSILSDLSTWKRYRNLVVVHCVRYPNELAYADTLRTGRQGQGLASLHYVPVVTARETPGCLPRRIAALLESGALEAEVGLRIDPADSRVLVCGNPDMVSTTRKWLGTRGLAPSRRGNPGQLAVENYW